MQSGAGRSGDVGPWAPRPAGGAGQPLLASLLSIDFCCSALLPRLLAAGKESSSHPPHLPLSGLGWPSLPTLPQRWLAPAVSLGPVNAALGHGRKAAREPMAVAAVFTCSGFIASPPPRTDAHCALSTHSALLSSSTASSFFSL